MGSSTSSPSPKPNAGECPVKQQTPPPSQPSAGGCPVKHDAKPSGCPVEHKAKQQYNVYAQPIDPTNQMPFNPNQLPAPGQKVDLSTNRVKSFIPKGGAEGGETWTYPSPQMFFNALVRKGKSEDVDENELDTIVAVHNNMNERAWNMVVNWEKNLHEEDFDAANGIKLSRFMGRPDDISPMAWFKSTFLGYPKPFDRHDWVIDRNGVEVRYVIDFYYNEELSEKDRKPGLHDAKSIQSITMDARPAVDSVQSVVDRIKYPVMKRFDMLPTEQDMKENTTTQKKAVVKDTTDTKKKPGTGSTSFADTTIDDMRIYTNLFSTKCKSCFEKVETCETQDQCQKASIALTYCMASLVCEPESERYLDDIKSEKGFSDMVDCMGRFETKALKLREDLHAAKQTTELAKVAQAATAASQPKL